MSLGIKEIVSKNKLRYKEDGFDLDLSYIARNIIAMGFPAETLERFYRNSINDVAKFFEIKHKNRYKIYNLCSESKRRYDITKFNGMVVEEYSFQDHNPPPFHKLKPFCESVHKWLTSDANNVAAIHCKAGKGRTGVMICAYLIYTGKCEDVNGKFIDITDADSALEYYGRQRTRDLKGVTIPSQKRYVYYYEYLVKNNLDYRPVSLRFVSLILTSLPIYNGGAFTLICEIYNIPKQKIKSFDIEIKKGSKYLIFNIPEQLFIQGDIKLEFFIKKMKKEKIFQFCFNTFFVGFGTDTYTVTTEACSSCSCGEKISVLSNNNNKTTNSNLINDQSVIDLSFLELLKNENLFYPCDCNSSILFHPPDMFDSTVSNDCSNQEIRTSNPFFISLPYKSNNTTSVVGENLKMSTSTSSASSSNSSSTHSLCKKISNSDFKTFNSEKNFYLVLPKDKLEKAYKDKSNKTFPANFKVVLRFNQIPDGPNCNTENEKNMECFLENCCNCSESENITPEDDDEPSDQEFNGTLIEQSHRSPSSSEIMENNNFDSNNKKGEMTYL